MAFIVARSALSGPRKIEQSTPIGSYIGNGHDIKSTSKRHNRVDRSGDVLRHSKSSFCRGKDCELEASDRYSFVGRADPDPFSGS